MFQKLAEIVVEKLEGQIYSILKGRINPKKAGGVNLVFSKMFFTEKA